MLKLKNVSFAYDNNPVLENINFQLEKGENLSVIGESGCGKSTLLKLIYGLLHTDGKIYWKDKELLGPDFNLVPGEPFIKYLAQDFDLMGPLSVADNIGKHLSNQFPKKKRNRVKELLEVVEMTELADTKANLLSGGQQQRVALARALAKKPELLLLDEPFSHIDHFRKNNLRRRIFAYLKHNKIACIVATHDSTDALSFADQTIVLKKAKIYAKGSPQDLYQNPPNKYVASLFGDVNAIKVKDLLEKNSSKKRVILYPEEIKLNKKSGIKARIIYSWFRGNSYQIEADLNGETIFFKNPTPLPEGEIVGISANKKLVEKRANR